MTTPPKPKALTVAQATARLQSIASQRECADFKLVLPFHATTPKMGASASKPLVDLHLGFDWNQGTVQLDVGEMLMEGDESRRQADRELRKLREECFYWVPDILKSTKYSDEHKLMIIQTRMEAVKKRFGGASSSSQADA